MTYSYGNERIDPRTYNPETAYLLGLGQAPTSPEEELRKLKEQLEMMQRLQAQAQAQAQAQSQGQPQIQQQPPANSSTTYAHLSPAPSFVGGVGGNSMPAQELPTDNRNVQGQGHEVSGSNQVIEDSSLNWIEVLKHLQSIAALELAGVCLYGFYSETLSGLYGAVVSEAFVESRDESFIHYGKALEMIIRVEGGRDYLTLCPDSEEMQNAFLPGCDELSVQKVLDLMIAHEAKAVVAYNHLVNLVSGQDDALENWGLSQVEIETRDLVKLQKLRGQR